MKNPHNTTIPAKKMYEDGAGYFCLPYDAKPGTIFSMRAKGYFYPATFILGEHPRSYEELDKGKSTWGNTAKRWLIVGHVGYNGYPIPLSWATEVARPDT